MQCDICCVGNLRRFSESSYESERGSGILLRKKGGIFRSIRFIHLHHGGDRLLRCTNTKFFSVYHRHKSAANKVTYFIE
uniref:Ovule protein n=1 Tax=Ascaris lumbricoides TaxID=6252 RepID=A0A0M3HGB6_ASCLU